jgi:hypothetical protein
MAVNDIPTRLVLEVVRDGGGRWDTRTIDLELGRRGAGPRWRLTELGAAWLQSSSR